MLSDIEIQLSNASALAFSGNAPATLLRDMHALEAKKLEVEKELDELRLKDAAKHVVDYSNQWTNITPDVLNEDNTQGRQEARDLIQTTVKSIRVSNCQRRETIFIEFEFVDGDELKMYRSKKDLTVITRIRFEKMPYDFDEWADHIHGWGIGEVKPWIRYADTQM